MELSHGKNISDNLLNNGDSTFEVQDTKKPNLGEDSRINSSLRMQYEAHVQVIRNQIGHLDSVRAQLGLSQRKICQLLMVDPSAWTRWTKAAQSSTHLDSAPPHIWRALQWVYDFAAENSWPNPRVFFRNAGSGQNA
jgi:hypothetical protein